MSALGLPYVLRRLLARRRARRLDLLSGVASSSARARWSRDGEVHFLKRHDAARGLVCVPRRTSVTYRVRAEKLESSEPPPCKLFSQSEHSSRKRLLQRHCCSNFSRKGLAPNLPALCLPEHWHCTH